jgi:LTXXQ motif family protein
MRKLTKTVALAALIASMAGGGVTAWAQTSAPGAGVQAPTGPAQTMRGDEHRGGHRDPAARLASLKTDLGIRPEQAAPWDTYSKVVLDTVARMQAARAGIDRNAVHAMAPADRDAFISKMRDQRAQAHATVKAAAQVLLPSLDATQQAKAQTELPGLKPHKEHGTHHAALGTTDAPAGPVTR